MKKQLFWIFAIVLCLGFGIWFLGFWGGGCTSTRQELLSTTSSLSGTTSTTTVVKGWQIVGQAAFMATTGDVSLFVYQGTPYVAYGNTVMKYNGANWESVGDLSWTSLAGGPSALFVDNGIPYVVGNSDPHKYPLSDTVFKFNGTTWEAISSSDFSNVISSNAPVSLYIDNGTLYVAFENKVMFFNGAIWENIGPPGPFMIGYQGRQFYVYNGTPYIAFSELVGSNEVCPAVVKYIFNQSTWESIGDLSSSRGAGHISLYIDNGIPYLAYISSDKLLYYVNGKPYYGGGGATVMKFNNASWESVGNEGFSPALFLNLYVSAGTPYVIFNDPSIPYGLGRASLMRYNGSSWEYVGSQGFNGNQGVGYTNLFIDNGIPFVAYRDGTTGQLTVMKYIE